ncbi:MAG: hypothetical protein AAF736_07825 [Pseudomonadota bacterium]
MGNWKLADRDLSGFLRDLKNACHKVDCGEPPPAWLSDDDQWRGATPSLRQQVLRRLCESRRLTQAYDTWKERAEQLRTRSRVQRRMGERALAERTHRWANRFWDRALRAAALAFERETRAERAWLDFWRRKKVAN